MSIIVSYNILKQTLHTQKHFVQVFGHQFNECHLRSEKMFLVTLKKK